MRIQSRSVQISPCELNVTYNEKCPKLKRENVPALHDTTLSRGLFKNICLRRSILSFGPASTQWVTYISRITRNRRWAASPFALVSELVFPNVTKKWASHNKLNCCPSAIDVLIGSFTRPPARKRMNRVSKYTTLASFLPKHAPKGRCKHQGRASNGTGIVRAASATFVIQPVKRCRSFLLAIVTQNFLHTERHLSGMILSNKSLTWPVLLWITDRLTLTIVPNWMWRRKTCIVCNWSQIQFLQISRR